MTDDGALPTPPLPSRLAPADVPVHEPLAWSIVTADGTLLFEAGTTVTSLAAHTFLFENFEPHKLEQMSGDGANDSTEMAHARTGLLGSETAGHLSLNDIGLKIGARLGLRGAPGAAMYSSRVIGFSTQDLIVQPRYSSRNP